jgi:hypothetical protein
MQNITKNFKLVTKYVTANQLYFPEFEISFESKIKPIISLENFIKVDDV